MSDRMPEDMPDKMPDRMPEDMPDRMPDKVPEGMPDKVPECLPDRMPEDLRDRMPDRMSEDMPDRMPNRMPEDMPDRMPEDMPDRMSEDLPGTKPINVMVVITRSTVTQSNFHIFQGVGTCWNHQPESNGTIEGFISHCSAVLLASWKNPRWKPLWTTQSLVQNVRWILVCTLRTCWRSSVDWLMLWGKLTF